MGELSERILARLEDRETAIADLAEYQASFTGRAFETLANADPYCISAADIVAVSMLSVEVPATAALRILTVDRPRISALLRQVPAGAAITDVDDHLRRDGAAWRLWDTLRSYSGMGPTKVSKLLAAKRPALVPIHDTYVSEALEIHADGEWSAWTGAMTGPDATTIRQCTVGLAEQVGALHLSGLRVIDIVVWMAERRRRTAPAEARSERK